MKENISEDEGGKEEFPNDDLDIRILTDRQRLILNSLRKLDCSRFDLPDMYLGAVQCLEKKSNPDYISQVAHSLRELLEKLPRVLGTHETTKTDVSIKNLKNSITERIQRDKELKKDSWLGVEINEPFSETLQMLEDYLEATQNPSRAEQVFTALSSVDPLIDQIPHSEIDRKKAVYKKLWSNLEGLAHHGQRDDEKRTRELLRETENIVFNILAPTTLEDHQKIDNFVSKDPPENETSAELISLIKRNGSNYSFFFKKLDNPIWLEWLDENGFFDGAPKVEVLEDGRNLFCNWKPVYYLGKVAESRPRKVVDIILKFGDVDNPLILRSILKTAADIKDFKQKKRLFPFVIDFIDSPYRQLTCWDLISFLESFDWDTPAEALITLKIIRRALSFRNDKKEATLIGSWPKPQSVFEEYAYKEILEKVVTPLREKTSFETAKVLFHLAEELIDLSFSTDDKGMKIERPSNDWLPRVSVPHRYSDQDQSALIASLVQAGLKVYEVQQGKIDELDDLLKSSRFIVLSRVRYHLLAFNINESTISRIRDIVQNLPYGSVEYFYETQLLIRRFLQYEKQQLSESELKTIFERIISSPTEGEIRDLYKERFSPEIYEREKKSQHVRMLSPFNDCLFGQYKDYFVGLVEDGYSVFGENDYGKSMEGEARAVVDRSPVSFEEFSKKTDAEIVHFLNTWEQPGFSFENYSNPMTLWALEGIFKKLFIESIIPNSSRLKDWLRNYVYQIKRPFFVGSFVQIGSQEIKDKELDRIEDWIKICEFICGQDFELKDGEEWNSPRRNVIDFIESLISLKEQLPVEFKDRIVACLESLCTGDDSDLDTTDDDFTQTSDPLDVGISQNRSRALRCLILFGTWIRNHVDENDSLESIIEILNKRLELDRPLTAAEHAILGLEFSRSRWLDQKWATDNRDRVFPRNDLGKWSAAMVSYLKYNRPFSKIYELITPELEFALSKSKKLNIENKEEREIVPKVGEHAFSYYLWGLFALEGEESLLQKFYKKTAWKKEYHERLFDYAGRMLNNSEAKIGSEIKQRVEAFFEWRFEVGNVKELANFSFWLEAKCLAPEWRLNAFSRILDLKPTEDDDVRLTWYIDSLHGLLDHMGLVMECFEKLTELLLRLKKSFFQDDKAKDILKRGLNSENPEIQESALRAQDNLLKAGLFDYGDL